MKKRNQFIPDQSLPGFARTTPSAVHQNVIVKHATGTSSKIRGRGNIIIGIWNTRTLGAGAGAYDCATVMLQGTALRLMVISLLETL